MGRLRLIHLKWYITKSLHLFAQSKSSAKLNLWLIHENITFRLIQGGQDDFEEASINIEDSLAWDSKQALAQRRHDAYRNFVFWYAEDITMNWNSY